MAGVKQFSIYTLFKAVDEMTTPVKNMSSSVSSLKANMKGLDKIVKTAFAAVAVLATGATLAIADFTKEAAKIERYIVRLSTKFKGSTKEAGLLVNQIQILAAKTPLQFEPLIQAADYLLAYGVVGKNIIATLKNLGDIAQGDNEKLIAIANAYGRIVAEDRVTRKRLQPLITSGVPIYQALSKVMGVTQRELSKAIQNGKITAKDLNKAIEYLTKEGGMFFENMEKQSQTLIGRWSTFKDLIIILKITLGKIFLPIAKETLEYLITNIERLNDWVVKTFGSTTYIDKFGNEIEIISPNIIKLTDNIKSLFEKIKKGVEITFSFSKSIYEVSVILKPFYGLIGGLVAVFLSLYFAVKIYIGIISFVLAFQKAHLALTTILTASKIAGVIAQKALNLQMMIGSTILKVVTAAQTAFNIALAANPVGAVILVIMGLVAVFILLYNNSETVRNAVGFLWDSLKSFISKIVSFKDSIIKNILTPINALLNLLSKLPGKAGEAAREAQIKLKDIQANTENTVIAKTENEKAKSGKIDVLFENAPKGTKIKTHGDTLGSVNLNTGEA